MIPKKFYKSREGGLVKFLIIILVLIILLSLLKINLRGHIDNSVSDALSNNAEFIYSLGLLVWHDYIKGPVMLVWSEYIVPFFKGEFLDGIRQKQEQRTVL